MSQDKELEIQRQFLEEATDYINTLEAVLLEVGANNRIDPQKINAALRAAHSIKGGAGMMGFRGLADLAHRLEDSFKVLKTSKNLEIDIPLQGLLLAGVDWLRQVAQLHAAGQTVEQQWLETCCYPVYEQLHERLGDPTPEDATSMLAPEDGQDIIPMLFATEVEGCLQRLEGVLADSDMPCLREEATIMAAELGGLGEMLQLSPFSQLCESVTNALETADDANIEIIARTALSTWRRAQALVLTNQLDCLPTAIDLPQQTAAPVVVSVVEFNSQTPELIEDLDLSGEIWDDDAIAAIFDSFAALDEQEQVQPLQPLVEIPDPIISTPPPQAQKQPVQVAPVVGTSHNSSARSDSTENTVRVSVKQLEDINDLFGELTIQRNSINVQLERLRKLMRSLSVRVRTLERENSDLRTAYDQLVPKALQIAPTETSLGEINRHGFDILELDRYSELHLLSQAVMETIVQVQEATSDIELSLEDTDSVARQLHKTSKQLQTKLTNVRMRPLSDLVDRFPRHLRELCVEYNKQVELKINQANTLIERNILEALNDPLMHLLRNAFDHGIEDPNTRVSKGKPATGVITISASHKSNRTIITISDDGNGIPLDKIKRRALEMGLDAALLAQATEPELLSLIFEPGFSTTDKVTSLSGRGVGMDVVRNNLKGVRGEVSVETKAGIGTTFTLSVPFTLSVTRVLLVECHKMLLAFPTDAIEEIFLLNSAHIQPVGDQEGLRVQDSVVPLLRLAQFLPFNCPRPSSPTLDNPPIINAQTVLMLAGIGQAQALVVDRCWGEQEVAIRQVSGDIPLPPGFSNCTILGDGRVVPLVSTTEMLHWIATQQLLPRSRSLPQPPLASPFLSAAHTQPLLAHSLSARGTILIVDDSINVRRFLALTLEKAGYAVEQAKDGQDAIDKLSGGLAVVAVICDIEMPRLDGYGFLARVKQHASLQHLPIAMLTSRSGDKHRQLALQLGAVAYFSKPYNEQELLQTLSDILLAPVDSAFSAN